MPTKHASSDNQKALLEELRAAHLPPVTVRKQIRMKARVSLRDLAKALNTYPMTVWRWEHGLVHPSRTNAIRYRQLLDELEALRAEEVAG